MLAEKELERMHLTTLLAEKEVQGCGNDTAYRLRKQQAGPRHYLARERRHKLPQKDALPPAKGGMYFVDPHRGDKLYDQFQHPRTSPPRRTNLSPELGVGMGAGTDPPDALVHAWGLSGGSDVARNRRSHHHSSHIRTVSPSRPHKTLSLPHRENQRRESPQPPTPPCYDPSEFNFGRPVEVEGFLKDKMRAKNAGCARGMRASDPEGSPIRRIEPVVSRALRYERQENLAVQHQQKPHYPVTDNSPLPDGWSRSTDVTPIRSVRGMSGGHMSNGSGAMLSGLKDAISKDTSPNRLHRVKSREEQMEEHRRRRPPQLPMELPTDLRPAFSPSCASVHSSSRGVGGGGGCLADGVSFNH